MVQRMEIKPNPQPEEIKSETARERNGELDILPARALLNIFSRLDTPSASHLAQSQQSMNDLKRKFSANTEWGIFWITEHSYFQGITYAQGKRMGTMPPNVPEHHLQKKIGVSIKIEFVPGPKVRALKIGLVQIVQHYVNNKPYTIDQYKGKMSVDAQEGYKTHIDVLKEAVDPMYVANIKDKKRGKAGCGASDPFNGQWGTPQQNATLIDEPQDRSVVGVRENPKNTPNSGQIFETTALALDGEQEGLYYGSVKWGWKTDSEGNFQILPLTIISMGSASQTFARAADAWNKGNNTNMYSNRTLPIPK